MDHNDNLYSPAADFLASIGMSFDKNNFDSLKAQYIEEMTKGLHNQTSSLPMIPTYLSTEEPLPFDTPCIAIDAGGTNLRIGLVSFDKSGKPGISRLSKMPMPGSKEKITKNDFFRLLAEAVAPLCSITNKIGFVFSYAVEILPSKDGKVLSLSKEIEVEGIENQLIGENLCRELKNLGITAPPHVIVLNDTAAALLVLKLNTSCVPDTISCGYILGTGLNLAYVEANRNIHKDHFTLKEGSQIINTETGAYSLFPQGICDKEYDATTANPGFHLFEKMTSGGYIGPLCSIVLKKAAENGLFSDIVNNTFIDIHKTSTIEISQFLENKNCSLAQILSAGTQEDKLITIQIINQLILRGAFYSAIVVAAAVSCSKEHIPSAKKILLSCDGSTFYKLPGFKQSFSDFLKTAFGDIPFEIVHTKKAPLLGAAIASLIN